ncbi:MAG: 16S rRNA (cytosine(1402)-N(4))-methyltransferase RsmH [Bacteroidaceae bacterium]|nr:16S rRNA (cytosine(1402)-N(4))-methyltransferase RsmH [Bacteroidaceae bacterium]
MSNHEKTTFSGHVPVMFQEVMEGLRIKPDGKYVDLTFGGGGHSRGILERMGPEGRLYGFDQDLDTLAGAPDDPRFTFVRSNFRYLSNWMRYYDVEGLDGILADLGVSSHHLDTGERGFSFRYDAPLDMRMNQRARLTAREVVNTYSEEQLANILHLYGELAQSRRMAAALVKARAQAPIETTGQLADTMAPFFGRAREKKDLARVFQALRIEVNGEMKALKEMLTAATEVLRPGGRLVVLTYHSLEDRMVKNIMRSGNPEGSVEKDIYGNICSPLRTIGKVQTPGDEELSANPRSRSAKLRVAEKTEDERE